MPQVSIKINQDHVYEGLCVGLRYPHILEDSPLSHSHGHVKTLSVLPPSSAGHCCPLVNDTIAQEKTGKPLLNESLENLGMQGTWILDISSTKFYSFSPFFNATYPLW